ncbi:transcription-repair coupling factor [Acidaminobacter sp. JC074]|uniref:transcription-repair coupling factor n=1 Tax=Acidaminobacter sp. JC074 TaxID=2530199 RepID=UPI001F0E8B9B|nr:transcription-repair coupling factor [Acidaminobacter sp. JC074]MCH4890675.1 transcription-repair coupling factor [Acidaminobacter sp. JC074]
MQVVYENVIRSTREYQELKRSLQHQISPIVAQGLFESLGSHVTATLLEDIDSAALIICHTTGAAIKVVEDLSPLLGDRLVYMPPKDVTFFDAYAHSQGVIHSRAKAISKILSRKDAVLVTTVESALLSHMDPEFYNNHKLSLEVGGVIDVDAVLKMWLEGGYEKVDMVEHAGQFAMRGAIIDVFSPVYEHPIRMELFDDEIDSIRYFDVENQKSIEKLESCIIEPCREIVMTNQVMEDAIKTFKGLYDVLPAMKHPRLDYIIETLSEGIYLEEFDKYHRYFFKDVFTIMDYFPKNSLVFLNEPDRVKEKALSYIDDFDERYKSYLSRDDALDGALYTIHRYESLLLSLKKHLLVLTTNLRKRIEDFKLQEIVEFKSREAATYYSKMDVLSEDLKRQIHAGNKIIIAVSTTERASRINKALEENGVLSSIHRDLDTTVVSSQVIIVIKHERIGYELRSAKYILLTEHELFGVNKRKKTSKKFKDGRAIKSFRDLNAGDYVVHENHGIGKYIGMEQLIVEGTKRDYLKITYKNEDFLYIPIDQMDLVQKYIGGEEKSVKLNKLSSNEWQKAKTKAKKVIEDMTDELLALYAERAKARGHAFSYDNEWQKQFEDLFPYEETPDQLKCIDEIKSDMESVQPMDRLLCGDVGFGKTEVALRAVFKAVMDGKQVVFLVPTTILAQQHYTTIVNRLSKYPVRIEMLSRFRTKKQQEMSLENLRTGVSDIVVGTHRVLSQDVIFKDLGLLVVDEEQRFGVKHKERIKHLKKNVDILTLTATPIPRTLHMSMVGIRDMSVIEDPPEERYPVQTYVVENDPMLVKDVLEREIDRSGQAYYVYNRVEDIDIVAGKIQKLIPHARVVFAHGQMSERTLEKIMIAFMNHEYDILVCTTIIETGLDIANANTILIDNADYMGLSQLYQLKGRVGRSNRLAYAYLMYKRDKVLSEVSEKRLKAIKEFTELGAGFKIAMRDLEIRGAGNLLGSQQHGHIASIGYDLYCKMLETQVNKVKGIAVEEPLEVAIDFKISAYIPSKFVENQQYKLELYKKISSIRNQDDAYAIEEEIEDRYGTIPNVIYNLLKISHVKALARHLKIKSVTDLKDKCVLEFADKDKLDLELISQISVLFNRQVTFEFSKLPNMIFRYTKRDLNNDKRLLELEDFLLKIYNIKNEKQST